MAYSFNPRSYRFRMWIAWALGRCGVDGLYGSPSLFYYCARRPTLRWILTGIDTDAAPITPSDPRPDWSR